MKLKTIDIHDAAALTIIADYPDMPEHEFEAMVADLDSEEAKQMAREVRESSSRLRNEHDPSSLAESDVFVRSAAASAGRW